PFQNASTGVLNGIRLHSTEKSEWSVPPAGSLPRPSGICLFLTLGIALTELVSGEEVRGSHASTIQTASLGPLPSGILESIRNQPASEPKGRFQIGIGRLLDRPVSVPRDPSLWERLPNGVLNWSQQLNVSGALGLRIHLEDLNLPPGSR